MNSSTHNPLVLDRQAVKSCHIWLPDEPKPIGGIVYGGRLYSYVRFYPDVDSALRGWNRLTERGNISVFTRTAKGLVLWVFEADGRLA
jgi:hypothetical protein